MNIHTAIFLKLTKVMTNFFLANSLMFQLAPFHCETGFSVILLHIVGIQEMFITMSSV